LVLEQGTVDQILGMIAQTLVLEQGTVDQILVMI